MFYFSQVYFCNTYLFNSFAVELVLPAHAASSYITLLESVLSKKWCKTFVQMLNPIHTQCHWAIPQTHTLTCLRQPSDLLLLIYLHAACPHFWLCELHFYQILDLPSSHSMCWSPSCLQDCLHLPPLSYSPPARGRFGTYWSPKDFCKPPAPKQSAFWGKPFWILGALKAYFCPPSKSLTNVPSFNQFSKDNDFSAAPFSLCQCWLISQTPWTVCLGLQRLLSNRTILQKTRHCQSCASVK